MAKVLLVDDDSDFREALEEALRTQGFDVTVAGDADSAYQVVLGGGIDVVVSDVRMPGDGSTLPKRLRGIDDAPPVILITAFDEPGMRTRVLWEGAVAYLQKPIELDWLRRAIESALATVPRRS
ncbi:MAG TPA: response regulator [Candidatus Limnocylindria bacterium]|nr:response regulator [Candidatus Limnocylindria bacterium]